MQGLIVYLTQFQYVYILKSILFLMTNGCCSNDCSCDCSNIPSNKMCQLTKKAHKFDLDKVKKLTSNPKFICKCCGRTANKKENLCSPAELK